MSRDDGRSRHAEHITLWFRLTLKNLLSDPEGLAFLRFLPSAMRHLTYGGPRRARGDPQNSQKPREPGLEPVSGLVLRGDWRS